MCPHEDHGTVPEWHRCLRGLQQARVEIVRALELGKAMAPALPIPTRVT